jgi:prepilin-type processing-associated H-X9-DG protein
MSARLKTATAVAGGALTALAIPAANAQAASHPGPAASHVGSAVHPKAAIPDSSCGGNDITWQDNHDNRYLEIFHSGKANGNWADAHAGNGTCTQHWFAVVSGFLSNGMGVTFDTYGMVNTNSEKCLAASTTHVGTAHVVQESCGNSHYNYRWLELAGTTGWNLVEAIAPGYKHFSYYDEYGIMACEDTASANHWIFTSWTYIPYKIDNVNATNCIWH